MTFSGVTVADTQSDALGFRPDWPAPKNVSAFITTRQQGFSLPPYDRNNVGTHVGDLPDHVHRNRQQLFATLGLAAEPCWLEQVHGTDLIEAGSYPAPPIADGVYAASPNNVCAVMTADCLPVLICDSAGHQVMALHGGWRGLAAGILAHGVAAFNSPAKDLLAYLGPAISQPHFEVGLEVSELIATNLHLDVTDFAIASPHHPDRQLLGLYEVARLHLRALGVERIFGGDRCTFREEQLFYSYRRDGVTGRMVSLIWKNA